MLRVIFLCIFVISVNSDIRCYDCDPTDQGDCRSPQRHNIKVSTCNSAMFQNYRSHHFQNVTDFQCHTIYFRPKGHNRNIPEGYYRGCIPGKVSCRFISELIPVSGYIDSCRTCDRDECNS